MNLNARQLAERVEWLTSKEAAVKARLCMSSFRKLVRLGRLPAGKSLGRRLVWNAAELDAAIAGTTNAPTDPIMVAIHAAAATEVRQERPRQRQGLPVLQAARKTRTAA
jgi:predicted DNA-binding transcriptional regulator AlpA